MELWFTSITSSIMEGPAPLDAGDSSEHSFTIVRVVHPTHNNLSTDI